MKNTTYALASVILVAIWLTMTVHFVGELGTQIERDVFAASTAAITAAIIIAAPLIANRTKGRTA